MAALESPSPGVRLEVIVGPERPLFLPSAGTLRLFEMAREIGAGLGLDIKGRVAGGGSDGNFTGGLGIATLDGIGVAGAGPHTHGECLDIGTLAARAQLIGTLIRRIAGGGRAILSG
jgi:glutamate carboxypeptidase